MWQSTFCLKLLSLQWHCWMDSFGVLTKPRRGLTWNIRPFDTHCSPYDINNMYRTKFETPFSNPNKDLTPKIHLEYFFPRIFYRSLIWTWLSWRLCQEGLRPVIYYCEHLIKDMDETKTFSRALISFVKYDNPKTIMHPMLVFVLDILWEQLVSWMNSWIRDRMMLCLNNQWQFAKFGYSNSWMWNPSCSPSEVSVISATATDLASIFSSRKQTAVQHPFVFHYTYCTVCTWKPTVRA